jgi:hypothetical protein
VHRPDDAVDGVAGYAIEQRILLPRRARHAVDPLRIGKLGGEVLGLLELEIDAGRLAAGNIGRALAVEVIAGGADVDRILAGVKARGRETVAAVLVGDDRDGDRRAGLLGGDQHAFHRPFLVRGDLAGERRYGLGARRIGAGGQDESHANACEQRTAHPHNQSSLGDGHPGPAWASGSGEGVPRTISGRARAA